MSEGRAGRANWSKRITAEDGTEFLPGHGTDAIAAIKPPSHPFHDCEIAKLGMRGFSFQFSLQVAQRQLSIGPRALRSLGWHRVFLGLFARK